MPHYLILYTTWVINHKQLHNSILQDIIRLNFFVVDYNMVAPTLVTMDKWVMVAVDSIDIVVHLHNHHKNNFRWYHTHHPYYMVAVVVALDSLLDSFHMIRIAVDKLSHHKNNLQYNLLDSLIMHIPNRHNYLDSRLDTYNDSLDGHRYYLDMMVPDNLLDNSHMSQEEGRHHFHMTFHMFHFPVHTE